MIFVKVYWKLTISSEMNVFYLQYTILKYLLWTAVLYSY